MSTAKVYHYVYRITNTLENKHYYGKRSSKIEPKLDLGIRYFSSSTDKEFIEDQKINPDSYEYIIVVECTSSEEALEFEVYLHSYYSVGSNPLFYNKVQQTSTKFDSSSLYTEEYRKHLSEKMSNKGNPMYGKLHSNSTKVKIKNALLGLNSPRCKPVNIYEYGTDKLLYSNVVLNSWCKEFGYLQSRLLLTTRCNRSAPGSRSNVRHHKGIYAEYL